MSAAATVARQLASSARVIDGGPVIAQLASALAYIAGRGFQRRGRQRWPRAARAGRAREDRGHDLIGVRAAMLDWCGLPGPAHQTQAPARGLRQLDRSPCAPLNRNARLTLIGGPPPSESSGNTRRDCAVACQSQPARRITASFLTSVGALIAYFLILRQHARESTTPAPCSIRPRPVSPVASPR